MRWEQRFKRSRQGDCGDSRKRGHSMNSRRESSRVVFVLAAFGLLDLLQHALAPEPRHHSGGEVRATRRHRLVSWRRHRGTSLGAFAVVRGAAGSIFGSRERWRRSGLSVVWPTSPGAPEQPRLVSSARPSAKARPRPRGASPCTAQRRGLACVQGESRRAHRPTPRVASPKNEA